MDQPLSQIHLRLVVAVVAGLGDDVEDHDGDHDVGLGPRGSQPRLETMGCRLGGFVVVVVLLLRCRMLRGWCCYCCCDLPCLR